jgi:hypothetical protein
LSSLNRGHLVVDALATIADFGEVTASELADHLRISRYDAHAVLTRLNNRTKSGLKRIHVVRYVYDHEGARKYPRAVYALGDKSDAKKPKPDTLANKRLHYHRAKARALTNSVFNLAAQWRAGT